MAHTLTDAEKASIVEMYDNFSMRDLDSQLIYVDPFITSAMDTKIKAYVVDWDALHGKGKVRIHPTESNRGVSLKYNKNESEIREKVGKLLFLPSSVYKGSGARLVRG